MFFNRNFLFLAGGIAVGAVGTLLVCHNKEKIKPLAAKLMSRVIDAKDSVSGHFEVVKENMEDIMAEAKMESDKRREDASKG